MKKNYWIGIIGKTATVDNFVKEEDLFFCLPDNANIGDKFIAYVSGVNKKYQGVYGFYEIESFNEERDCECRGYGAFHEIKPTTFVNLKVIKINTKKILMKQLKKDPILRFCIMVRRNAQATCFEINENEYKQFEFLSN